MNKEVNNYLQKRLNPSFWDKIRHKFKIMSLSEQEVKSMRIVLIDEGKPFFIANHNSNDKIDELIVRYYDERIETLPKDAVYDLYNLFVELKNAIGKEYEYFALLDFTNTMNLMYSLNGWFRGKLDITIKSLLI